MTDATTPRAAQIIRTADEITSGWLAQLLEDPEVRLSGVERVGTGQMSLTYRASYLDGAGTPSSVVVKLASDDQGSRGAGVDMSAYLREISFYQILAPRIAGPTPVCHLAEYDRADGWFTLVLQDLRGAEAGDQLAGCDLDHARLAMSALAQLHAPVFDDVAVGSLDFLNIPQIDQALLTALLPGFLERYSGQIDPAHAEICRRYVEVADAQAADIQAPVGLIHGDFRLDNLLFGSKPECVAVDWQTVRWGSAMFDAAYFLGTSFEPEVRRAHEHELMRHYYDTLIAGGVKNFDFDTCWKDYRRQSFPTLAITIAAAMLVERTERGDAMFLTMLRRGCTQISDLDALELLPTAGSAARRS